MKHARSSFDSVQDASGNIPEDEPVFLLRSSDSLAPLVVRHWADMAAANGVDARLVEAARAQALAMADYGRGRASLPTPKPGEKLSTLAIRSH